MTTKHTTGTLSRERLVKAAQDLHWKHGVAATTPRQVLERSGVGQGSLYHHFPTKRDLSLAAVTRTVEEMLESAGSTLLASSTPPQRIREYLSHPRDAVAGCRVGRLTADAAVMSDSELQNLIADYFVELIAIVTDVFAEDGMDRTKAQQRATAAIATVQGGYVISRALGDPQPMADAINGMLELLEQKSST